MTDKELKAIYEYMEDAGWDSGIWGEIKFNSNSAWEVVQEMERKGDWNSFEIFVNDEIWSNILNRLHINFTPWLYNPTNFFNCFTKWLEEKENQKGGTQKAPENSHFEGTKNDLNT